MSIRIPKKMGRPRVDSEAVNVRMERPMLDALDGWIAEQPEAGVSRPDAVREAVAAWMAIRGKA